LLAPRDISDYAASDDLAPLREALSRRSVDVRQCSGAADAMAELMLHERDRRARRTREPIVVVFVSPERTDTPGELFEAASRFAPSAVFWEYQTSPVPRLAGYRPSIPTPPAEAARPAAPRHEQPRLRLAIGDQESGDDSSPAPSTPDHSKSSTPQSHASLLSDEELAMLLGDEPPRPNQ